MKPTHLAHAATLLLIACGDPLVDPQTLIGLRVLGAKLSATDDPSLAQISPGQNATLSWLVVADRERDYSALTVFCKAEPGSFGVPRCGATFEQQRTEASTLELPAFTFELPDDFSDEQEWLSFLALCEDGEPRWDKKTQRFSCSADNQPVTSFYHAVSYADANHNPALQDDNLRFDGDSWPETDATASCDTSAVPRLRRDQIGRIELAPEGSDSEALDDPSYAAATNESLTYIHVATTAGLARAFSAIDPNAKTKRFDLDFTGEDAWADVGKQSLGTFYLVVSDGRGGSDWLQRHYCLTK